MREEPVTVTELTYSEAWDVFDRHARSMLDMSGATFERLWRAGAFAHSDDTTITTVALLYPGAW